ncbi:unnamed protein product, partial [Laminaria digitata]
MTPPGWVRVLAVAATLAFSRGAAVPAGTSDVFIVRSAEDAARLARAASRSGAVLDVSWVGSVMLDTPIKVGTSTRLTISGVRADSLATTHTPRPRPDNSWTVFRDSDSSATEEGAATGGIIARGSSSVFDLGSDASLLLQNMSLVIRDSCDPIFNLRSSSRVDAHESSFEFRNSCGDDDSGDREQRQKGVGGGSGAHTTSVNDSRTSSPMGRDCSIIVTSGGVGGDAAGLGLVVVGDQERNHGAHRRRRAGSTVFRDVRDVGGVEAVGDVANAGGVGDVEDVREDARDARHVGGVGDVRDARDARDVPLAAESTIVKSAGGHNTGGASTFYFPLAGGTATPAVECRFFTPTTLLRSGRPGPRGNDETLRTSTAHKELAHPVMAGPQGGSRGAPVGGVVEGELFLPTNKVLETSFSSSEGGAVLVMHDSFILVPSYTRSPAIDGRRRNATPPQSLDETHPSGSAIDQHRRDTTTTPQSIDKTALSARKRQDSRSSSTAVGGPAIPSTQEDDTQPSGQGSPPPATRWGSTILSWTTVGAWWTQSQDRVSTSPGSHFYRGRRLRGGASTTTITTVEGTPTAAVAGDGASVGAVGWLFGNTDTAAIDREHLVGGGADT